MTVTWPNNHRPCCVGLGEVLWDLLPGGRQLGGAPANFACHARALGAEACVVSRVGDDELGREALAEIDRFDPGHRYVQIDQEHPTGTVSIELDSQGKPSYVIQPDAAWDYLVFSPELAELAGRADAVCFGSLAQRSPVSRATIRQFLLDARPDCLRVYDVNLRQSYYNADIVQAGIQAASALKLNDEELPRVASLLGIDGVEREVVDALLSRYRLRLVAVTRGARGAMLVSPTQCSIQPGIAVHVADSIGAGDAFAAAMTMGLLAGHDLDRVNRDACRVASYVCGQPGAMPRLPDGLAG